jgi:hypothetical protein
MNKSALWYKKAFNNFHFTKVPESFFMNPSLKTTGLFLTPRGPYGRRLPERARKHLRASEDDKPDPTSQGMQGLGGQMSPSPPAKAAYSPSVPSAYVPSTSLAAQMAPNDQRLRTPESEILHKPGFTSPSVKEQLQKQYEDLRRQGFESDTNMTPDQKSKQNDLKR